MVIQEFFHNLETGLLFKNELTVQILHYFFIFLVNAVSYLYIFIKFYKVICYSKMTFEWLPMVNPYIWPFSFFQVLTEPYFSFWAKILPSVRLENSSIEISGIIALEALNSIIYFCVRFTHSLLFLLEETEKTLLSNF
jgi:uncharacterized protein YggT (Ycf19 family)